MCGSGLPPCTCKTCKVLSSNAQISSLPSAAGDHVQFDMHGFPGEGTLLVSALGFEAKCQAPRPPQVIIQGRVGDYMRVLGRILAGILCRHFSSC